MIEKLIKLLESFDSCTTFTKLILCIVSIVVLIVSWKIIYFLVNAIKSAFNYEKLFTFIQRIIKIVIPLELTTIAGLINLFSTIILLAITLAVFLSASIAGFLGFAENVSLAKLFLVGFTILTAFISLWILYRFHKEKSLITNGSA